MFRLDDHDGDQSWRAEGEGGGGQKPAVQRGARAVVSVLGGGGRLDGRAGHQARRASGTPANPTPSIPGRRSVLGTRATPRRRREPGGARRPRDGSAAADGAPPPPTGGPPNASPSFVCGYLLRSWRARERDDVTLCDTDTTHSVSMALSLSLRLSFTLFPWQTSNRHHRRVTFGIGTRHRQYVQSNVCSSLPSHLALIYLNYGMGPYLQAGGEGRPYRSLLRVSLAVSRM